MKVISCLCCITILAAMTTGAASPQYLITGFGTAITPPSGYRLATVSDLQSGAFIATYNAARIARSVSASPDCCTLSLGDGTLVYQPPFNYAIFPWDPVTGLSACTAGGTNVVFAYKISGITSQWTSLTTSTTTQWRGDSSIRCSTGKGTTLAIYVLLPPTPSPTTTLAATPAPTSTTTKQPTPAPTSTTAPTAAPTDTTTVPTAAATPSTPTAVIPPPSSTTLTSPAELTTLPATPIQSPSAVPSSTASSSPSISIVDVNASIATSAVAGTSIIVSASATILSTTAAGIPTVDPLLPISATTKAVTAPPTTMGNTVYAATFSTVNPGSNGNVSSSDAALSTSISISPGIIAGISVACCVVLALIGGGIYFVFCRKSNAVSPLGTLHSISSRRSTRRALTTFTFEAPPTSNVNKA